MIRTYYTIDLKSYLNHSSGEGDLLVDTDIATDYVGLPIISGRAIKGLLRESMEETLERKQILPKTEINRFFGIGGYERSTNALKFVSNAVIQDYRATFLELYQSNIPPHEVKAAYTKILSQTCIDEDGTAKDGSLRFTRVINFLEQKQLHFYIDSKIDLSQSDLFKSTLLNLRQMGVNRNRGLGSIKLSPIKSATTNQKVTPHFQIGSHVKLDLELKAPVLLPKKIGDQNTTYSETCIRGNLILGALAYDYLNRGNAVDHDFLDAFVFGGLVFSDLSKNGGKQFPQVIAKNKYAKTTPYLNSYELSHNHLTGQPLSLQKEVGYITEQGEKIEVDKMFSFHISRNENRLTGTSSAENGAIFYYEYLVPFQQFQGNIYETQAGLLAKIIDKIGIKHNLTLGASKSTQYGEVTLELSTGNERPNTPKEDAESFYMVLESPCLVFNEKGFPSVAQEDLQSYFPENFLIEAIKTKKEFRQRFNGQWRSKTTKVLTWAAGSTFFITGDFTADTLPLSLGEQTHTGFGRYTLYSSEDIKRLILKLNQEPSKNTNEILTGTTEFVQELNKKSNIQKRADEGIQKALGFIGKDKDLPNNLLHNLKAQLADRSNFEDWIKKIESKSAGKKLIRAGWYKPMSDKRKLTAEHYPVFKQEWLEIVKQQMSINRLNV